MQTTNSNKPHQPSSVTARGRSFTVAASPLNTVKFELAVLACALLLLWILMIGLAWPATLQWWVLGVTSWLGMIWLVLRARRVLQRLRAAGEADGPQ